MSDQHDMSEYLQTFLDETEEQLDDLVETMLALESNRTNPDDLNEAFRLIHSIKGSAGLMGFDSITVLTHHLENRFERLRSGLAELDVTTTNLVLRCIDFLRQCNDRMRNGEQLASASELLEELKALEEDGGASAAAADGASLMAEPVAAPTAPPAPVGEEAQEDGLAHICVQFRAGLQLADLKAQLIIARLAKLGEIKSSLPDAHQLTDAHQIEQFSIWLETDADLPSLRSAADVDGVESIEVAGTGASHESAARDASDDVEESGVPATEDVVATAPHEPPTVPSETSENAPDAVVATPEPNHDEATVVATIGGPTPAAPIVAIAGEKVKVAETMRVDIDRLDSLMNLAGELVVNRARFVQISGAMSPALRKANMINRVRDFSESMRHTIASMEMDEGPDKWSAEIQQLRSGLELMDEQARIWDNGRQCLSQMTEAIDQLSRVSDSLQRSVLDTRMVPVGPLFTRFRRVVRDLAKDRGKEATLVIRGEHTELDKRMIDELGDPLVHLVRNCVDHGLEPPDVRLARGKSAAGTIVLDATHSGNHVFIQVSDDGGGIDGEKIKAKLLAKNILSDTAVAALSDQQAVNYIWDPGFSTAQEVTDVSGRGVGMDAVKQRVEQLNGTITVDSTPLLGTTFAIRLPLTLAIINSLLVRLRHVVFAIPIEDVREIVSVNPSEVVTVQGKQTFDVRGEFIPLIGITDVFNWHEIDYGYRQGGDSTQTELGGKSHEVVILQAGGHIMGLRVDELMGGQDIVIKSLSDNFMHIRGLSGASILGDGSVCLMLDVGTVIQLATRPTWGSESEDVAT